MSRHSILDLVFRMIRVHMRMFVIFTTLLCIIFLGADLHGFLEFVAHIENKKEKKTNTY